MSEVYVEATLTFSGQQELRIRTVHLGATPGVFIEPKVDGDVATFKVSAHDVEQEDLADILVMVGNELRHARVVDTK